MESYPKILITRNNDSLSLILGGSHRTFIGDVQEIFLAALQYYKEYMLGSEKREATYQTLMGLLNPLLRKEIAEVLTTDGKYYYLGKTKTKIPMRLAQEIVEFNTAGFPIDSLVNFWKRCLLNSNERARDDFFEYCKKFGITITQSGLAILYKSVTADYEKVDGLAEFVSQEYLKTKRWKKAPSNYFVQKVDDGYRLTIDEEDTIGNLQALHENIGEIAEAEGMKFRPWYSGGSHGTNIRLGVPVTMPREDCDSNINNACSFGLHVGSYEYVRTFGGSSSTILACLVNPTDIVALPEYDTSKIRTCQYTPYAIIERDENDQWEEIDSKFFELDEVLGTTDSEFINLDSINLTEEDVEEFRCTVIPQHCNIYESDEDFEDNVDDDDYCDDDYDDEDYDEDEV